MPFLDFNRVIYKTNAIVEVICQLRFPPILAIDSEIPSEFQTAIREDFPIYEEHVEVQHNISANISGPDLVNPVSEITSIKNHTFLTADSKWRVNLTRTFISISTRDYNCWEDFIDRFHKPFQTFIKIYNPPFFTRAGLRYVDVFCRSKLGLQQDTDWVELIQPSFLGILTSNFRQNVSEYHSTSEVSLQDNESRARVSTMLVRESTTGEQCFMVDSDIYTSVRQQPGVIVDKLNFIHERSTRLLRSVITDKLHHVMEPIENE